MSLSPFSTGLERGKVSEQDDYQRLRVFLKKSSGLQLEESKRYVVEAKILPILKREGLASLADLVYVMDRGQRSQLADEVVQAMTVNETSFFRDKLPFDAMRDEILPRLVRARSAEKVIRIWSAACSTGQEPYSLAMLCADAGLHRMGWQVQILATDLCQAALAQALSATYSDFEISRGLSVEHQKTYFQKNEKGWRLKSEISSMIVFKKFNLLDAYENFGIFDVIFCRNVLIYMDIDVKTNILAKIAKVLKKDGVVCLGASESVLNYAPCYEPTQTPGLYRLRASF